MQLSAGRMICYTLIIFSVILHWCDMAAAEGWRCWGFDGSEFRADLSSPAAAICLRDGYLPSAVTKGVPQNDRLPAGNGAVAGICYLQVAGGKEQRQISFQPIPGVALELLGGSVKVAVRSGTDGLFIVPLPAGSYEVKSLGTSRKVRVEAGKTSLIHIRGGKRMSD